MRSWRISYLEEKSSAVNHGKEDESVDKVKKNCSIDNVEEDGCANKESGCQAEKVEETSTPERMYWSLLHLFRTVMWKAQVLHVHLIET